MHKRIRKIRETLRINKKNFAKILKVDPSHITRIEKNERNPSQRLVDSICREFNVNEHWLRTGEGEMFIKNENDIIEAFLAKIKADDIERAFIKTYVKLNEFQRKVFQDYLKAVQKELSPAKEDYEPSVKEKVIPYDNSTYKIPVCGKVAGGAPILAVEEKEKMITTNIKCDFALELKGDSMSPEYNDGDILLIKRQPWLENGEVGIILLMEAAEITEATCKKFYQENGNIILKSINPAYDDIVIKNTDVMVLGKVVGKY